MMDYSTVSMQELSRIENLPQSVEEFCSSNKLFSLEDFIDYWKEHGTFSTLEDCGDNMEIVLSSVANKYALLPLLVKEKLRDEDSLPGFIPRLEITKKILLCQVIAMLVCDYRTKVRSWLLNHSGPGETDESLFRFLYGNRSNFLYSEFHVSTLSKIMQLKNRISYVLTILTENNNRGITDARQKLLAFLPSTGQISEIFAPNRAVSANDKIALFKLIELLIEGGFIFDSAEREIFRELYCNKTRKNKDNIVSGNNVPPNYYLRHKMQADFRTNFICLSFLRLEDLSDYDLDLYADVLVIDTAFVNRINAREHVRYTRTFYENVLAAFLSATHDILDGTKEDNRRAPSNTHSWKASYIIKKDLTEVFNFLSFISEVKRLYETERETSYTIDFEKLLKDFMAEGETRKIHKIRKTCLVLLYYEFNLSEDKVGLLVLPSPTGFQYKTILCKILERLALPATLNFLIARLKEIKPDLEIHPGKIKALMIADKERFTCIGETVAFGLVAWRRTGKRFSTQSIEALAIKILRQSDTPLDIDQILSYIRQYRLITPTELSEVLRQLNGGTFIVFKNDMVGLKHKNYSGKIISHPIK